MFALTPRTRPVALLPRLEAPFDWMMNEFTPLFDRFLGTRMGEELSEWPLARALTMEEREREVVIRAELPGFEPPEVRVEVLGDRLTVEAEHREAAAEGAEAAERVVAHVRRVLTLPPEVELEKIEATYRNGVLEVRVPRIPEAVARRIEVKA